MLTYQNTSSRKDHHTPLNKETITNSHTYHRTHTQHTQSTHAHITHIHYTRKHTFTHYHAHTHHHTHTRTCVPACAVGTKCRRLVVGHPSTFGRTALLLSASVDVSFYERCRWKPQNLDPCFQMLPRFVGKDPKAKGAVVQQQEQPGHAAFRAACEYT